MKGFTLAQINPAFFRPIAENAALEAQKAKKGVQLQERTRGVNSPAAIRNRLKMIDAANRAESLRRTL